MRRFISCFALISRLNIATGIPRSIAIFLAIDKTNAVLPMAGRAAMIMRSDFCHPAVILSIAGKPEDIPLIPSPIFLASCISDMVSSRSESARRMSCWIFCFESSKRAASASCICTSDSIESSYALVRTSEAKEIKLRLVALPATIWA